MTKKTLAFICIAALPILLFLAGNNRPAQNKGKPNQVKFDLPPLSPTVAILSNESRSIFVPYWAPKMEGEGNTYDTYYYFGVRPGSGGQIEDEVGLQNIAITDSIPEKRKKLVLRMLDASVTDTLLQEKSVQKTLLSEIRGLLMKKSFSGLIIDLEVPYTFQAQKKDQITNFVQQICTGIKSDYKTCEMLIYGDFSYRNRPYDLKALGEITDAIFLMAYDFHKAGGEPGPNFPLNRRNQHDENGYDYGYDFKAMVKEATSLVPKEKLGVVFGMYGYDWTLNEQGKPLKTAQALSVNDLELKAESLKLKVQSNTAKEKRIDYVDSEGRNHVIWYEDEESATLKTRYLLEMGIGRISFWALSYF